MDILDRTAVTDHAARAIEVFNAVDQEAACLVKPRILAEVFLSFDYPSAPEHLGSVLLDSAHDAYVGQRIARMLPRLLALHAQAMAAAGDILTWEADRLLAFIHHLPERSMAPLLDDVVELPAPCAGCSSTLVERKAFVLVEQSIRFLVVMTRQFGAWDVHVRQWFPDPAWDAALREDLDERLGDLLSALGDSPAGDVAANRRVMAERCALLLREVAGTTGFGTGNLGLAALVRDGWPMDDLARITSDGLRYEDGRDPGYVLSFDASMPSVKDALGHFALIRCFMQYAHAGHTCVGPVQDAA